MVTIIKTNASIATTIAYNENKVKIGSAQCIGAGNFPVDLDKISPLMKLKRFSKLAELNEISKRNTIHISINFSPLENHPKEKLIAIAHIYMHKIGFGKQPYLIYQHYDAGHEHLHVITTNIQKTGKLINLYKIGINKSEPARKEIEKSFGLIRAESTKKDGFYLQPISIAKVQYGKMESKKAITDVLNYILEQYNYTNFPELNAILGQYNVIAERCRENSKIFLSKGLLYKILNEQGKPIGKPIKASVIENKPILSFLENKFKINALKNIDDKKRIKKIIEISSLRALSINELRIKLNRQGITTVTRNSSQDNTPEIIFIDHKTKNIINGNTLNTPYNLGGMKKSDQLLPACENKKNKLLKIHTP